VGPPEWDIIILRSVLCIAFVAQSARALHGFSSAMSSILVAYIYFIPLYNSKDTINIIYYLYNGSFTVNYMYPWNPCGIHMKIMWNSSGIHVEYIIL